MSDQHDEQTPENFKPNAQISVDKNGTVTHATFQSFTEDLQVSLDAAKAIKAHNESLVKPAES